MHLVCGQLYERRPSGGIVIRRCLSCCFSAAAVGFSGRPVPVRSCAVLTDGLPAAGQFHWTATGLPCSTLVRYDRCRAPPIPRDRGAHMTDTGTPVITAASQRRVLFRARTSHLSRLKVTRLTEVHLRSPFPAFPLPVTDGWNISPWASSRASHPAVASDACQERERASSTHSESTTAHAVLQSIDPLNQRDFTSHSCRLSARRRWLLESSCSRWGIEPSSRSAYRCTNGHRTPSGLLCCA
jgi:hypothetical protein